MISLLTGLSLATILGTTVYVAMGRPSLEDLAMVSLQSGFVALMVTLVVTLGIALPLQRWAERRRISLLGQVLIYGTAGCSLAIPGAILGYFVEGSGLLGILIAIPGLWSGVFGRLLAELTLRSAILRLVIIAMGALIIIVGGVITAVTWA